MEVDPLYNEPEALAELRGLSPAAKDLLRDRIMNPLAGCTNWLQMGPADAEVDPRYIERALKGAWKVKENFDAIFS